MRDNEEDYKCMYKWLNDPELLTWIEGPNTSFTIKQIINKYQPRTRGEHYVTPCIIEYDNQPIGYVQYYPLQITEIEQYGASSDDLQYGLDIYIGESAYWNQGIGTKALKLLIQYLFTDVGARNLYIDPHIWNARTISSYQKCGFEKVKVIQNHSLFNGELVDSQIMTLSKEKYVFS